MDYDLFMSGVIDTHTIRQMDADAQHIKVTHKSFVPMDSRAIQAIKEFRQVVLDFEHGHTMWEADSVRIRAAQLFEMIVGTTPTDEQLRQMVY